MRRKKTSLKKHLYTLLFFSVLSLIVSSTLFASSSAEEHEEGNSEKEKFNAGDMIFHHIKDAYEWHICEINGHSISIYLPVIIYSREKGLTVFSSQRFNHGHDAYEGYKMEHGHIVAVDDEGEETGEATFWGFVKGEEGTFLDISITKNVMGIFISALLLCVIFITIAVSYKKREGQAPKGLQSFMEPMILFVRDEVAKPSIGKQYEKFMPYLLSIFFFIWLNNLMGLIPVFPGGANVTGNVAVTMVLALFTFIITTAIGNKAYWTHVVNTPGVPWWLKIPIPLMPIVEIMGLFTKPFVLMLRLFANIMAGHITILSFIGLIFIFSNLFGAVAAYSVSVVSIIFSVFLSFLELLVAFIQAYVFTLLSALYFGLATEEHH